MDPSDITDCLKAEWAKSRARAARWTEEQDLILEEMRRVLAYLKWQASWWEEQATRQSDNVTPAVLDSLSAYAAKQASILRHLRRRFACMWRPWLLSYGLDASWLSDADLVGANITDRTAEAPAEDDNKKSLSMID
ncbi:hypothetical protein EYR38_003677 [Pleurotus pulmonarius]|nr:hypothetical protein EYR38_003677 [Pleurotus pulmonarius]